MARKHFGALEGVRGIAALVIMLFHTTYRFPGYLAVEFFMMLSGFVMAHAYLEAPARLSSGAFLWQRLARLYPLHLFALLAYVACYAFRHQALPEFRDGTTFTFVQHLLLLHNVGLNPTQLTWNFPAWTVSVELMVNLVAYCLLPRGLRSLWLALAVILLYTLILNSSQHLGVHHQVYWNWLNAGFCRGLAGFLLGWLVFRTWRRVQDVPGSSTGFSVAELLALGSLVLLLVRGPMDTTLDFAALPLMAGILLLLGMERGALSRILRTAPLQYLGRISFGIYLLHIPVQEVLHRLELSVPYLGLPMFMLLYWSVTIACAALVHAGVETPARAWMLGGMARWPWLSALLRSDQPASPPRPGTP